jgi:hypothetical protein
MLISVIALSLPRTNISLSVLLSIAGILWINADRRAA